MYIASLVDIIMHNEKGGSTGQGYISSMSNVYRRMLRLRQLDRKISGTNTMPQTLHLGHFLAFGWPYRNSLVQRLNSSSPCMNCLHVMASCHGAWHVKHHSSLQSEHVTLKHTRTCAYIKYSSRIVWLLDINSKS